MKNDLTGKRFSRLLVISATEERYLDRQIMWKCLCDCGNEILTVSSWLKDGTVQSCGCLNRELTAKRNFKHGMTKTDTYRVWRKLFERCYNPKDKAYAYYGGRGISICERWYEFINFLSDMGLRPKRMQIDRINNNGNYEPSNCRWATSRQNNNNRRDNLKIEYQGESHTIREWSDKTGIKYNVIHLRLYRRWPIDSIFTKPIRWRRSKYGNANNHP